jgi:hypothetical protein
LSDLSLLQVPPSKRWVDDEGGQPLHRLLGAMVRSPRAPFLTPLPKCALGN